MAQHVKILAWLHIIFGALGLFAAFVVLLVFGGIASIVGFAAPAHDARVAIPILGTIGGVVSLLIGLLSLPGIIAGVGLLSCQQWARVLTLVLSAFELLNVPIGTLLGVYGFWVLLSGESDPLFNRPAYR